MYLWVLFCSGVHRTQYRTPMNPQFANDGEVVVCHEIDGVKFNFFCQMAQYGVLEGCKLYFDFENAIHDQFGCPEASKGQTRGQK